MHLLNNLNTIYIMIKAFRTLAIMAIAILAMTACSGKKQLDTERIKALVENTNEYTESDCDFIIDQLEVIADMTQGMDDKEAQDFLLNLPQEQQEAILYIGLAGAAAEQSGSFTDAQKKRLEHIKEKLDQK